MDIQESLRRILEKDELVADLFYIVFLDRHAEVRRHFINVDMRRQALLLTMALQVVVQYYLHGFPTMAGYLKILGEEHSRRGIEPELYPKFCDALLGTLSRFHSRDWNDKLAQQWQQALDLAVAKMVEAYQGGKAGPGATER
jgi:hemoglobin-like flavoprotein